MLKGYMKVLNPIMWIDHQSCIISSLRNKIGRNLNPLLQIQQWRQNIYFSFHTTSYFAILVC
jgi:hypothetical protein